MSEMARVSVREEMAKIEQFMTDLVAPKYAHSSVTHVLPCFGWRWFTTPDNWIVMEPKDGFIDARTMSFVDKFQAVARVEAVFRSTPHVAIYLRFQLRNEVLDVVYPSSGGNGPHSRAQE